MSYASLLTHRLAIVTPTIPDPDDVDAYGDQMRGVDEVVQVRGLVQPRSAKEAASTLNAGAELSTHVIFLLPQRIGQGAYIRDDPDTGRRFEITGVRSLEFGTVPHLEVDALLVGSTEGPGLGS